MGVVVGTIIGSGIFRVSASVANDVGSVSGIVAVWIVGGIITLCGSLSLAELGATFPASGGVFVYLREVYGRGLAFVFGWTMLILQPAAIAGIALVFGEYLGTLAHLTRTGVHVAAASALIVGAVASYRSVRGAGALVGAATWSKVIALGGLVVVAFLLGDAHVGSFGAGAPVVAGTHWSGIGLGLVSALWAYNGIQEAASIAGEVRDPARLVPRALLGGTAIVIAAYLSANAAYLYVLPFDALKASPLVASETAVRVLGPLGTRLVAGLVMLSTFGAVCGLMLTTPRVYYAMAREGLLFASLGRVHSRFGTPHVATVATALVSLGAVWSSSFEQLAEAFILGVWPFLALAAAGIFVLRRRRPDLQRPFRTPGYPAVPIVFIAGTFAVVGSALVAHPASTLLGIGLTLVGVPIYAIWRRVGNVGP